MNLVRVGGQSKCIMKAPLFIKSKPMLSFLHKNL